MELLYEIGVVYGFVLILTQSKIAEPIRNLPPKGSLLSYFLKCVMCTSVWFYWLYSLIIGDFEFFTAFLVSGVNYNIYLLQLNLEKRISDEL